MDCPKEWPELFPTLLQAVESVDILIQHRSLLTLYHVIKAISSKRLAGGVEIIEIQVIFDLFLYYRGS